ncbi:MAG TPA: putative Ig domain-containing protein [Phycisphaerae bacterium]|nr:putative Ig domain-containing protein [Phycisphaerae bacterium]
MSNSIFDERRQSRRDFIAAMLLAAGASAAASAQLSAAPEETIDEPELNSGDGPEPALHGPRITGGTPGRPFLFKVPYTGQGTVRVSAENLPAGLSISEDGIISGTTPDAGEYLVALTVASALGSATRKLKIVAGDHKLALTPQMGWNSWNSFAAQVKAENIRQSADAMVASGLAAKGYAYVNIDDTWEGVRDSNGNITANQKFGDMKALGDYVHAKGLKFGIYSSPGPTTCNGRGGAPPYHGKYAGSYQHEIQDARTYAEWGVDYLKYDWCSYRQFVKDTEAAIPANWPKFITPYALMQQGLNESGRDILFSLCQYGLAKPWLWAPGSPVFGNSWRITGDIRDKWASILKEGFITNAPLYPYAGPGHWNDPDMLVVGRLGWGRLRPSGLTKWEQVTHITLWCMQSAPLLIGCDMSVLDPFTIDVLTNTEVLDVSQDVLGKQAVPVKVDNEAMTQIYAKPLWDGTYAVALFNLSPRTTTIRTTFAEDLRPVAIEGNLIAGDLKVRDLWKRKDVDETPEFSAEVASHGAVMLKVGTPQRTDW